MRTLLATVALALTTGTAVLADAHFDTVKTDLVNFLDQHGVEYEAVDTLTDEQLASIDNILKGDDDASAKEAAILGVLGVDG